MQALRVTLNETDLYQTSSLARIGLRCSIDLRLKAIFLSRWWGFALGHVYCTDSVNSLDDFS